MTSAGPSPGPSDRAVIPPTVLAAVLDIGHREGQPVTSWFSGTGLDPALLYAPGARVSLQQARTVLRRALAALPGRALGMEVGERDVLLSFGLLGVAMRASETVGEGLALAQELHQAIGSLLDVERENLGSRVGVRFRERWPDAELVGFLCEEALVSTTMVIRSMLADPTWAPLRVDLAYPRPAHAARYHRTFRCPVAFGAEANRMVFPATLMERRLPTGYEPTRRAAIEACRNMLAPSGPPSDLVASLETLLAGHLRRPLSMRDVAARLHVTERTLHRRLAESGVRFRDIADRVRERRATSLLRHSSLPVGEVAAEVGFGDSREFRRAYVRWTGRTPSQARRDRSTGPAAGTGTSRRTCRPHVPPTGPRPGAVPARGRSDRARSPRASARCPPSRQISQPVSRLIGAGTDGPVRPSGPAGSGERHLTGVPVPRRRCPSSPEEVGRSTPRRPGNGAGGCR